MRLLHSLLIFKNVCPANQSHVVRPSRIFHPSSRNQEDYLEDAMLDKSFKMSDNLTRLVHVVK